MPHPKMQKYTPIITSERLKEKSGTMLDEETQHIGTKRNLIRTARALQTSLRCIDAVPWSYNGF
ncbi:unnamed protein product [Brassica rapa subsp. narinosa]